MTGVRPPAGGGNAISLSALAGGQMTPFDWASCSLRFELPPLPTVGESVPMLGEQAASGCGRGVTVDCACTLDAVMALIVEQSTSAISVRIRSSCGRGRLQGQRCVCGQVPVNARDRRSQKFDLAAIAGPVP
jgi:hypothetical protein